MPKRATRVKLSEKEREELEQIIKRRRSEQQQVLRARIVLAAAHGHSNAQIARELAINVDTARLWRDRWVGLQGIEPSDAQYHGALARCPPTRNASKDQQRATLSNCCRCL